MKLATWLKRREALSKAYGELCSRGSHLVFLYDRGEVPALALIANSKRLDAAYQAICALDKAETTA